MTEDLKILFEKWGNNIYRQESSKNFDAQHFGKMLDWMKREYDNKILVFWKPFIEANALDEGIDADNQVEDKNTIALQLWVFILRISEGIVIKFKLPTARLKRKVPNKQISTLHVLIIKIGPFWIVKKLVGNDEVQGKSDHGDGGVLYGFFGAPNVKNCSTNNEYGAVEENRNFMGFGDANRVMKRKQ